MFRIVLFCLSAATITRSSVINLINQDAQVPEYYQYQVVPENQEKVNIKTYYEVLCPACISFHTGPLRQVIEKIGSYLDVKSYPFGNAWVGIVNGTKVIKCQHGELECYGNKLHACAIDILKNDTRSELFNSCMMSAQWGGRGSTNMDATNCGRTMGIDAKPIIECASGQRGEELFEYYGKETKKVPEIQDHGVPYIMINGIQYTEDYDFWSKVCGAFTNAPPQCKK